MKLFLRERGAPVAVSPADWRSFRLEETVGALARAGVVRIERTSAAIILTPRNFVGEMHAPNVSLTIRPKDKALYDAILALAVQFDGKDAQNLSGIMDAAAGDDLATPFVESLVAALDDGLPWEYRSTEESTSQPRGKLRMSKTVSEFLSRGVLHRIVAIRHDRQQIQAFVNLIWAAYLSLPAAPGATQTLITAAARLIEALGSQDGFDAAEIAADASALLQDDWPETDATRRVMMAALAIVQHDLSSGRSTLFVPSGVARFTNLERVWERAVACLVEGALQPTDLVVALHGLATKGVKLFGDAGPTINPDVTATSATGDVILLADAKYKILAEGDSAGNASDIYQLTCYVNRTQSQTGLLVYLGSKDGVAVLGETESGGRILVVVISSDTLRLSGQGSLAYLLGAS
jgi:hypothetical protein